MWIDNLSDVFVSSWIVGNFCLMWRVFSLVFIIVFYFYYNVLFFVLFMWKIIVLEFLGIMSILGKFDYRDNLFNIEEF